MDKMNGKNNLLDNPSGRRPPIFNDLTGKETLDPRADLTTTLTFLHEAYVAMIAADAPKVNTLAVRFAVTGICHHMGWLPIELSVAEEYIARVGLDAPSSTG